MRLPCERVLDLHNRQAVCALALALHPALSLSLCVELDRALGLAAFVQSSARAAHDDLVELLRMAPSALHCAHAPRRARVVVSPSRFDHAKLVYIKQEVRAVVHTAALVLL